MRTATATATATGRAALVLPLIAAALVGCGGGSGAVDVSTAACGSGWSPAPDGRAEVSVRNVGNAVLTVDLVDSSSSDVFARLSDLAPGTARQLQITLPNGSFRLDCTGGPDTGATRSPVRQVSSSTATRGHPLRPVSTAEANAAVRSLTMQLILGFATLTREVRGLDVAVQQGDLAAARTRWLQAHTSYDGLGGAGGVFGSADPGIDGLTDPSSDPKAPDVTGFHRVEYLLWNGGPTAQLRAATASLANEVTALERGLRSGTVQPGALILAPRQILETVARSTLTGDDDFGSHSGLATLASQVAGAARIMQVLKPLLQVRNPELSSRFDVGLAAIDRQLTQLRRQDGSYPSLQVLGSGQREQLDAAVSGLLEVMALVPTTLQLTATADPD
jgi:hypothetical protein